MSGQKRERGSKDPGKIPPRWLSCPRKGSDLIGGKFLPFKTPLGHNFDPWVPEECRFPPSMLLDSMSSYKVKIGLWIDLTFTSRFYDRTEVEEKGVKYLKLQCRGHGEPPTDEQTHTFIALCQDFISRNPLEIVAVHCTHGFNRTGFLICAYLIDTMDWSLEAAVNTFAQHRSPGIYKEDYLEELHKRFGDVTEPVPVAPPLPDWCNEPDDNTMDDEGEVMNGTTDTAPIHKRRRREIYKKDPVFMEGVPGITPVVTQPKLLQLQRRVQDLCEWKGSGFPGLQPVSMDRKNLALLTEKQYMVSWKADGTRYMMLIDGENEVYFIDRDNSVFQVENLQFPHRKKKEHISATLLDGEMVIDKVNGQQHPRYLVYDIIKFDNLEVGKTDFGTRLHCIKKEIIGSRQQAHADGRLEKAKEPFSVRLKEFWDLPQAHSLLSEKFTQSLGHEPDGLIFQPKMDAYKPGQCFDVLKWKPSSLNTVDFRLSLRKRNDQPGMLPETIGCLFVGGKNEPFATMKGTKALKEHDNKIIECKYANNQWQFLRVRTDKSFPNARATAEAVCESIANPVTEQILFDVIDKRRWRPPKKLDSELMPPPVSGRPPVR